MKWIKYMQNQIKNSLDQLRISRMKWNPGWNGFAQFDTFTRSTPGHLVFTDPQSRAMTMQCYAVLNQCWISGICLPFPGCKSAPGPSQRRAKFLEAQRSLVFIRHAHHITVYPSLSIGTGFEILYNLIEFISGVFCGRKYLVTYPSSRRRMLWDLLGLMLVIWAPWLQRIADPSLQWGQVLSCINMYDL
jgi:hypothetical protein